MVEDCKNGLKIVLNTKKHVQERKEKKKIKTQGPRIGRGGIVLQTAPLQWERPGWGAKGGGGTSGKRNRIQG